MLCPLGSLHIALDLERCSTTDCGLPPTRLLSMPILSRIIAACGLGCCGRNCCMNPIVDCLQCRAYLGNELVVLLLANELSTVNLDGLLLDVRLEVEALDCLHSSAVSGNYVEARPRIVEKRWRRAVGRKLVLHRGVSSVDLDDPVDGLLVGLRYGRLVSRVLRHGGLRQIWVLPSRVVRLVWHHRSSLLARSATIVST